MADLVGNSSVNLLVVPTSGAAISQAGFSGYEGADNLTYCPVVGPTIFAPSNVVLVGLPGGSDVGVLIAEASGTSEPAVPILAPQATDSVGVRGAVADYDQATLGWSVSATGSSARPASSAEAIPLLEVQSTGFMQRIGGSAEAVAFMAADGEGQTARPGESSLALAMLDSVSAGSSGAVNASQESLPLIEFESAGFTSRLATAILTLPAITGEGSGIGSMGGVSEVELPMWTGEGSAGGLSGMSMLELPAWIAVGYGDNNATVTAGTAAAQGVGYAMHTQTKALVQDVNNRFNSYAVRGSVILAANEDGLFVLGAATDAGVNIDSSMVLPVSDMEESALKRISQMTVGYRSDGRMLLKVMTDDGQTVSYTMAAVTGTKCQPNRIKVGRGSKSRYWEFGIENVQGSDHAIDKMDIDWQILSRRVP